LLKSAVIRNRRKVYTKSVTILQTRIGTGNPLPDANEQAGAHADGLLVAAGKAVVVSGFKKLPKVVFTGAPEHEVSCQFSGNGVARSFFLGATIGRLTLRLVIGLLASGNIFAAGLGSFPIHTEPAIRGAGPRKTIDSYTCCGKKLYTKGTASALP
jgi:hypothetical protein